MPSPGYNGYANELSSDSGWVGSPRRGGMMNYYDENGNLVASTTFKDASGRYYVDGLEATEEEYEEATRGA